MPASRRFLNLPRTDGSTPLALAAGLAIGHVVAAMAESGVARTLALPSAILFVAAAAAAVVCALHGLASRRPGSAAPPPLARWITALGTGLVGALAHSFL